MRQRSGKFLESQEILPDLLTLPQIQKMYPNRKKFEEAYLAYFQALCQKSIKTSWGAEVNLTAHRKGSVIEAFEHITYAKEGVMGAGGFSLFRATYLSWLELLLSSDSTTTSWYQAWTRGSYFRNRMVGNLAGTNVIAVIQAPKYQGADLSLVTFFPAEKSILKIKKAPIIPNPSGFFNQKIENPCYA
jgi:hypothetical protein